MRTVSVDFDGVIHAYTQGWTGFKPEEGPTDGAAEAMRNLKNMGFKLAMSTCRVTDNGYGTKEIRAWLRRNKMSGLFSTISNRKPIATAYIDDRAVAFNGDWATTLAGVAALDDRQGGNPWA